MLIELRGKLDKIARHIGSGKTGVCGVGEHAMQAVAKLVEHRRHIIKADQRRLARGGLGEVGHVVDHRQRAQQFGLSYKFVHPRSAVLVVALEIVAVPQSQRLSVGVKDLVNLYVGVVDRDVGALFEGNTVKLVRSVKDAVVQHVVQLEIGPGLRLVQIIFRLAHLLGIKVPVRRLERESAMLRIDERLNILCLALSLGGCRGHQRVHELERCFRRAGHLVCQLPSRVVGVAQQFGLLRAQLRQTGDNVARVVRAAALRAIPRVLEERLPRGAIAERLQAWLLRGVLQRKHPAIHFAIRCGLRGGGHLRGAQSRQRLLVLGHKRRILGGGQQFRSVRGGKIRLLLIQLLQRGFVSIGKPRAGQHKFLVLVFHQAQRFSIEMQRMALLVDFRDALKQFGIQVDRILHCGQFRRLRVLDRLQHGIHVRTGNSVEDLHHAVNQPPTLFHRYKGVFKRRRRGIVGDGARLLNLLCNAGLDRRLVVRILDLVEGRRMERQCAGRVERVAGAKARIRGLGLHGARCERDGAGNHQRGNLRQNNPRPARSAFVHENKCSLRPPELYRNVQTERQEQAGPLVNRTCHGFASALVARHGLYAAAVRAFVDGRGFDCVLDCPGVRSHLHIANKMHFADGVIGIGPR